MERERERGILKWMLKRHQAEWSAFRKSACKLEDTQWKIQTLNHYDYLFGTGLAADSCVCSLMASGVSLERARAGTYCMVCARQRTNAGHLESARLRSAEKEGWAHTISALENVRCIEKVCIG